MTALIPVADRVYEIVLNGKTYCSPSLSQLVKHLNSEIADEAKRFYQPTLNNVVLGRRKTHNGATGRVYLKSEYKLGENATWINALTRDQYVMHRRHKKPKLTEAPPSSS
jgi:hypothetical protein